MSCRCVVFAAALLVTVEVSAADALQETLLDLEKQVIEAIKRKDKPALKELLSEESFAVTSYGGRQTGAEMLGTLDDVTLTDYSVDDVKLVEISDGAAMLSYQFTWSGGGSGLTGQSTTVYATSVWARRDGTWRSIFYQETPTGDVDTRAVADAAGKFYAALNELFEGNVQPMEQVWSHAADVAYMGPGGGMQVGWDEVLANWRMQAARKLGGEVHPEKMRVNVGQDLAVARNFEVGENVVDGEPRRVRIRATSLFRRENDQWKMIGHHTDLLPFLEN
ncbi:MAG: DUF4440 domain-containing protein [Planctomycetales bacterium]|nr:DUF4440 domain-containing protein [Planctomycetales bacterium]